MMRTPTLPRLAMHLLRLMLQLVLLPVVALVVPLVFGLAWLHEAIVDLARSDPRGAALLPSPALARLRDGSRPRP